MKREHMTLYPSVLADCFEKVRRNFYEKIDEKKHARVYEGIFPEGYAEPEFTGKFLDLCAYYYESEGDDRALRKGMEVIHSIEKNIRADGYLGCHEPGKERAAFSFWNHGFTLYGITRMYEATGDPAILSLVRRAADFVEETYRDPAAPDILEASNKGSQNISCLYAMGRAYLATGERRYLDFIGRVLAYCERTDMPLLSFGSIFDLRSQKGIEMLVVYLGVLQYGLLAGDRTACDAARRYMDEVLAGQVRNTGGGTLREAWTVGGNAPRLMPTEEKPNETCVAVGIVELALALFCVYQKPAYLDAAERSLFNHMAGSLEKSGADLAYYQGNFGRKIYRTDDGAYQCCRYRGFTLFSYLKEYAYTWADGCLYPTVYLPGEYEKDGIRVRLETDYPTGDTLAFTVKNTAAPFLLKLRIPAWCKEFSLEGASYEMTEDGFCTLSVGVGELAFVLRFVTEVRVDVCEIEGRPYLSATYGAMLLAHDTRFGGDIADALDPAAPVTPAEKTADAHLHFTMDGHHLVDFASAGSRDPENDRYTVYIPAKK